MSWPTPQHSKTKVNKAGQVLIEAAPDFNDYLGAFFVVDNWRACHGYPINTFQATLRQKLKLIESNALVAQRLKRLPSIINKLKRTENMQLARMQDIGGLRAIVSSIGKVRDLEANYRESRFQHKLVSCKDYIADPKESGYRGIHLVYRYKNIRASAYDGLHLELQIRTRLQHAWATAVETMGTFLNFALKSSEGPDDWLNFFSLSGSAFAHLEATPLVPGFKHLDKDNTYEQTIRLAKSLNVKDRLQAFSIAAERIHSDKRRGSYHLIILDPIEKTVKLQTFSQAELSIATHAYSKLEEKISQGEDLQAVLVSAGHIENLRRAYPNYFLDTREFIRHLNKIERQVSRHDIKRLS